MIISDEHRIVFIHIPKCAGSYVRNKLRDYDSRNGLYSNRVDHHEKFGIIDYTHIPLSVLHDEFPDEYRAVEEYRTFALFRNPYERFASSVSQHVRVYRGSPIHSIGKPELLNALDDIIETLARGPQMGSLLPYRLIHFQRQMDYVSYQNLVVIDDIYTLENISDMLASIFSVIDPSKVPITDASDEKVNQSLVYRNDMLKKLFTTIRPVSRLIRVAAPSSFIELIEKRIFLPRERKLSNVFGSQVVEEFVEEYYEEDIKFYKQLTERDQSRAV